MNVLKGIAEIEMLCLNSRENFEDNKRFLRDRMEQEQNPVVRKLLEKDLSFLDRIQMCIRDRGPDMGQHIVGNESKRTALVLGMSMAYSISTYQV